MKKTAIQILIFITLIISGCHKDDGKPKKPATIYPAITISDVIYIGPFDAFMKGELTKLGTDPVADYGFICSLSETSPISQGIKLSLGKTKTIGLLSGKITGLAKNQKYFARAFVSTQDTTIVSESMPFTTTNTNQWVKVSNGFVDVTFTRGEKYLEINGKAYLFDEDRIVVNNKIVLPLYEYNPAKDSFRILPPFPDTWRLGSARFAIDNKVYVGMGSEIDDKVPPTFWSYNVNTRAWNKIKDFVGAPMYAASAVTIGDKAYLGYGRKVDFVHDSTLWEYNSTTDNWTKKSYPPFYPFFYYRVHMAVSINGKAYFVLNRTVLEYSPLTDTWIKKTNFVGNLIDTNDITYPFLSFATSSKGYMADDGGNIWEYDPLKDTWKQLTDPPNKSTFSFGLSIQNNLYLGSKENVYMYVPE